MHGIAMVALQLFYWACATGSEGFHLTVPSGSGCRNSGHRQNFRRRRRRRPAPLRGQKFRDRVSGDGLILIAGLEFSAFLRPDVDASHTNRRPADELGARALLVVLII